MKIVVTGSSGFIGANLVARLAAQGHEVHALDIKDAPLRSDLYLQATRASFADLREVDTWTASFYGADRVYHLAADHGGAGYFHSDADFKAALNNEIIDRNVLKAAMTHGVKRLFFASSACTYPTDIQGEDARPLRESDWGGGPAEALYGERKRMSTLFFEGARQHGLDARSGLFHTIYGPGQDYEEPRAKFPTAICRKMLENPNSVEVWGDGTQVRTFLFIDDALDRIEAVMENPYSGPVNIGSDEEVTVGVCCEYLAEQLEPGAVHFVYVDGPVGVAHRASDNAVWNARYGEGQLTTARDGFHKLYEWMKANC